MVSLSEAAVPLQMSSRRGVYKPEVKSGQTSLDGSAIGAPSLGIRESYITQGGARIREL